jgi:hypothetical protein
MCKWQIPKQYAYVDQTAPTGREFKRFGTPIISDAHLKAARASTSHTSEYISVYGWKDWIGGKITPEISKTAFLDGVFFDFDDMEHPENALMDAAEVAAYVGHCTCNFSGAKGAHVLIHCHPVNLIPDLKGHVIRQFVNNLVDVLPELSTLDFAVVGDTSRVHRIIDSVHPKTKLHAIGLAAEELATLTIDEVRSMAANRRGLIQVPEPSQWVTDELYRIEGEIIINRYKQLHERKCVGVRSVMVVINNINMIYQRQEMWDTLIAVEEEASRIRSKQQPDLRGEIIGSSREETWLIHAVRDFKATGRAATGSRKSEHKARVHLAKLADECGWTFSEICDIFTGADDYDPGITKRMVQSCSGRR